MMCDTQMIEWLEDHATEDDLIPGAYFHLHIQTWEVTDSEMLIDYIENGD